jgi:hypothetical protein
MILNVHAITVMLAFGPLAPAANFTLRCGPWQLSPGKSCCCGTSATARQCTKCSCTKGTPRPEPATSQLNTRAKCVDAATLIAGHFHVAVNSNKRRWSENRTDDVAAQRLATLQEQGVRLNI